MPVWKIWKGQFSPMSTQKMTFLKGLHLPEMTQEIYSKQEVFPITFNYYLNMANSLIKEQGLPDFQPIIDLVGKAAYFATTTKEKETISLYKRNIQEALANIKSTKIILPWQAPEQEAIPASVEAPPEEQSAPGAIETPPEEEKAPVAAEKSHETENAPAAIEAVPEKETSETHN